MTRRNSRGTVIGMCLLAASGGGAVVAQTTTPNLPTRSQARGLAENPTPGLANQGGGGMAADADRQKLVAHGLSMAIEGYILQCAAREAGPSAGDREGENDPVSQLRQHARAAFAASDRLLQQAVAEQGGGQGGASGAGAAGPRGGATGSGGATGAGGSSGATGGATGAGGGTRSGGGAGGSQAGPGASGGSQASGGSGGAVAMSGPTQMRFQAAANAYAGTLRRLAPEAEEGGEARKEDAANRGGSEPSKRDKASIAVLNHAVCELTDAHMIRQGATMTGSSSMATRALVQHADQMDDQARRVIQAMASRNAQGDGAGAGQEKAEGQSNSASVATLARHAQEIARAVGELGQGAGMNGGAGAGAGPGGAAGTGVGSRANDPSVVGTSGSSGAGTGSGTGTGGTGTGPGSAGSSPGGAGTAGSGGTGRGGTTGPGSGGSGKTGNGSGSGAGTAGSGSRPTTTPR